MCVDRDMYTNASQTAQDLKPRVQVPLGATDLWEARKMSETNLSQYTHTHILGVKNKEKKGKERLKKEKVNTPRWRRCRGKAESISGPHCYSAGCAWSEGTGRPGGGK